MKAILGGWGYANSKRSKAFLFPIQGAKEWHPYALSVVSHERIDSDLKSVYPVPPLSRRQIGHIDILPFLIYDQVIMDAEMFERLLSGSRASQLFNDAGIAAEEARLLDDKEKELLVGLQKEGILQIEDFFSLIEKERDFLLSLYEIDFYNPALVYALLQSLRLWRLFLIDRSRIDRAASKIIPFIERLDRELWCCERFITGETEADRYSFLSWHGLSRTLTAYTENTLDQVNSSLTVSSILGAKLGEQLAIYDWEDHQPFYALKNRTVFQKTSSSQTARRIFSFFVPWFDVHTIDEVIKIREDLLFAKVRKFTLKNSVDEVNEDLLIDELFKIEKTQQGIQKFNKVVAWITPALAAIPILGDLVKTRTEALAHYLKSRSALQALGWSGFFANYRENFTRDRIAYDYRAQKGGVVDDSLKQAWRIRELAELESKAKEAKYEVAHLNERIAEKTEN